MLKELHCNSCGGNLNKIGEFYECESCKRKYEESKLNEHIKTISEIFGEALAYQKEEQIANIRRNLWNAAHEQYVDSIKIIGYCRELKMLLPDDFMANFLDIANSANSKTVNNFIDSIDTVKYLDFVPEVVNFMLKSLTAENLLSVNNLIERAYKQTDLIKYDKYTTLFAAEAAKVDDCVYDVSQPRDVFVAYSSANMGKVSELVEILESEGLTCFVAMRNLQHGRGAVANYEKHLQEAIDNCKAVVLVSSVISRTNSDARRKELPYIRKRDLERAPAEYANDYSKLPNKYKKPRVEYLIENYKGMAAESYVREFFSGNEYRYTPKEVAEAIFNILAEPIYEEAPVEPTKESHEDLHKILDQLKNIPQDSAAAGTNVNNLLIRANRFMEEGDNKSAIDYYNRVLDADPNNAEAFFGMFLIENKVINEQALLEKFSLIIFDDVKENKKLKNALNYADGKLKERINLFLSKWEALAKKEWEDRLQRERQAKEAKRLEEERLEKERLKKEEEEREAREGEDCFFISDGTLIEYSGIGGDVHIPNTVKTIGIDAFREQVALSSITIPNSVTKIDFSVFWNCKNLTKAVLPDTITDMSGYVFYGCKSLKEVSMPKGLSKVPTCTFDGCESLKNIEIPNNITSIESSAFAGSGLTSVKIPNSVKSIGLQAFSLCYDLKKIVIPKSVELMGELVFRFCKDLTIYCEAEKQPKTWNKNWNAVDSGLFKKKFNVVWGYKGE